MLIGAIIVGSLAIGGVIVLAWRRFARRLKDFEST